MNNANYNIRCKSWLWNLVLLAGRNQFSSTIGNTIYLTPKRWEDYTSGNPSPHTTALIEHEATHVRQSNREGQFRFSIQYLFSRKHRLGYEIEAYGVQIDYLRRHVSGFDVEERINRVAEVLASWRYLIFIPKAEIASKLRAEVEKLNSDLKLTIDN